MRFVLGWGVKLGFLAVVYLAMTGNVKLTLPDNLLGDIAARTQAGFKEISDRIK